VKIDRRGFLKAVGCACATYPFLSYPSVGIAASSAVWKEASHYEKLPNGKIHCLLCPNSCVRGEGERSKCRVREAKNGKYYSLVYGAPCVIAPDPVEKCPLFHFELEGNALSIATAGCNLSCQYCQNWQFSQKPVEETKNFELSPKKVIEKAKEYLLHGISFFYTEPTIYFEYMKDIAVEAKKTGMPTIMVTAGYINPTPLKELFHLMDAFVVGLKGFSDGYYEKIVGGTLQPVLKALVEIKEASKHLEVVTLLVPTCNDGMQDIQAQIDWLVKNLGVDVPLHFTRFNPQFKLKGLPPTPVPILREARKRAMDAGIKYVYTGNIPADEGNHTFCPTCKKVIIERLGFQILRFDLKKGACPYCGTKIAGRWK